VATCRQMLVPNNLAAACLPNSKETPTRTCRPSLREGPCCVPWGTVSAGTSTIHANFIFQFWGICLAVHLRQPWHDLGPRHRHNWCPHRALLRRKKLFKCILGYPILCSGLENRCREFRLDWRLARRTTVTNTADDTHPPRHPLRP